LIFRGNKYTKCTAFLILDDLFFDFPQKPPFSYENLDFPIKNHDFPIKNPLFPIKIIIFLSKSSFSAGHFSPQWRSL
jgi:hypothetical protein